MADAEAYAKWIVENAPKKGTPEFDTVAQAYQAAKAQVSQKVTMEKPLENVSIFDKMFPAQKLIDKGVHEVAGRATDLASNLGASPEVAGGIGTTVDVGIPSLLGAGIGRTASGAFRTLAEKIMGNAIGASVSERLAGKSDTAIKTMLDEGLNVSKGGVDVLKQKIGDLNQKVKDIISGSDKTVDKNAVLGYLDFVLKKFENRPESVDSMKAVEDAWARFANHPKVAGESQIPIQTAQDLKRGYQQSVGEKAYGDLKTPATESEKSIARGLREKISEAEPLVAGLNANEQKLITTLNIVERKALSELSKNQGGMAILAHSAPTFFAYMADKSPLFKSLAARMINANRTNIPSGLGAMAGGATQVINQQ